MQAEYNRGVKILKVFSKLYINYKQKILPRVSNVRGAIRIRDFLRKLSWSGLQRIEEEPTPLREEEWDNLIILDACRHDIYSELLGECQSRITMNSNSKAFIRDNFSDYDFSDTIYITANPFFSDSQFIDATGRKPEEVFHSVFRTYENKWDEGKGTVLPASVTEDALTAERLFPEKKKIIHYMQPHIPFLEQDFSDHNFKDAILGESNHLKTWDLAMMGKIDREDLVEAYKENLKIVKEEADNLGTELSGKTVITADHGTFLGENGLYDHPPDSNVRCLREVPWDEI
jgi:hypothetical protein